jgi:hypothetical protein
VAGAGVELTGAAAVTVDWSVEAFSCIEQANALPATARAAINIKEPRSLFMASSFTGGKYTPPAAACRWPPSLLIIV